MAPRTRKGGDHLRRATITTTTTILLVSLALVMHHTPLAWAFQGLARGVSGGRRSLLAIPQSRTSSAYLSTFLSRAPTTTSQRHSFLQSTNTAVLARKKKEEDEGTAAAASSAAAPTGGEEESSSTTKKKTTKAKKSDDKKDAQASAAAATSTAAAPHAKRIIGAGPRNRRQISINPEEEEFSLLSDKAPPPQAGSKIGGSEAPTTTYRRPPIIRAITSAVPPPSSGPPKKKPLTINPNWEAPKGSSSSSSSGKKKTTTAGKQEERVRPPVVAASSAFDDEDDDGEEGGEDLLDLPKNVIVRGLDSKSYAEARRLANLDDDDDDDMMEKEEEGDEGEYSDDDEMTEEEKERFLASVDEKDFEDVDPAWEEDDDDDDLDDDDDELDLPVRATTALSMEERLAMASRGNMFNPSVAKMHTRSGPSGGGGSGGSKEKEKDLLGDEWEEIDDEDEEDFLLDRGNANDNDSDDDDLDMERKPQPVKYQYKIVMDVGTCPGCGNSFQTKNDSSPGFVPTDVYQRLQQKLLSRKSKAAVAQQQQKQPLFKAKKGSGSSGRRKGGVVEEDDSELDLYQGLSAEEEVEMLISGKDRDTFERERRGEKAGAAMVVEEEEEEEEEEESDKDDDEDDEDSTRTVICQRCHKLKHYGEVEDSLRPGWTDNEALTPERFRDLVSVVRKKRCAVVCLVDIFDFHGSLLYNLPRIVGDNPVLIAVNKADLLPSDFSEERIRIWVKQELEKVGMKDISTRQVHLISCKTGSNVKPLLRAMKTLARTRKRDLYVIGAANVGKSTFINRLIELGRSGGASKTTRRSSSGKAQRQKEKEGAATTLVTTSPLPGTTLNFIEVDLGDKVSLYDTPGLILPHQITTMLNTDELKAVIPQKRINHVTLRLKEGKSVLLGGLVRLDMVEGRPFLFTFYVSNEVKLHQTNTERAEEFLEKHVGELVFPPFSAERLAELGKWVPREFEIEGTGWKTSAIDIVISGLGWISVTGALGCKVRVMAPETVGVRLRAPLMPFETWSTTAKWGGLRAIKKDHQKGGSR